MLATPPGVLVAVWVGVGGAGVLVSSDPPPSEIAAALHGLLTDEMRRTALGGALQERVTHRHSRRRWLDDLRHIYQELS